MWENIAPKIIQHINKAKNFVSTFTKLSPEVNSLNQLHQINATYPVDDTNTVVTLTTSNNSLSNTNNPVFFQQEKITFNEYLTQQKENSLKKEIIFLLAGVAVYAVVDAVQENHSVTEIIKEKKKEATTRETAIIALNSQLQVNELNKNSALSALTNELKEKKIAQTAYDINKKSIIEKYEKDNLTITQTLKQHQMQFSKTLAKIDKLKTLNLYERYMYNFGVLKFWEKYNNKENR